jgi:hypothetical protein
MATESKETPIQRARGIVQRAIYESMKDMVKGTAKRGKVVIQLAKRYKIARVTVNKYFRQEELRIATAIAEFEATPNLEPEIEFEDTDFEYAPNVPPEGLKDAAEYVRRVGGFKVDNFGTGDATWPWEGASVEIEQMTNNEVVIHMTVTISQEQMIETVLGLMTKSNIGFTSKLIG